MYGLSVDPGSFRATGRQQGDYQYYDVAPRSFGLNRVALRATPRVRSVYFPLAGRLAPAYYLELEAQNEAENEAYGYVVAADDGRVLYRADLVAYDAFTYRVFADGDAARHHAPTDGPLIDTTPFPEAPGTDIPTTPARFIQQIDVTVEGFNTNPAGAADPWLPADATTTSGNNARAYADHDEVPTATGASGPLDGQTGVDPTAEVNPPGSRSFLHTYDPTLDPAASATQIKAAITQLFYQVNWQHDFWYDSGFDEAAGVAQNRNFGRAKNAAGEVITAGENDAIEVQAQDKLVIGSRDNANMSTPADGAPPRMQMFLWNGREVSKAFTTTAATFPTAPDFRGASFGASRYDVTAAAIVANDGVLGAPVPPSTTAGTLSDGCETLPAAVNGKIVIIDRGFCGFAVKAVNAQKAGARAVVVVNNAAGTIVMGGTPSAPITIPAVMIPLADGATLKAAIAAGAVDITLQRERENDYDGTIDNTISAHEWGHYLHHRLVQCGGQQCGGMSEGWADFNALLLSIKAGDNVTTGTFASAAFAGSAAPGAAYYGIRRYPYTLDRTKNPLSFRHIATTNPLPPNSEVPINPEWLGPPTTPGGEPTPTLPNSEVHAVGELWASIFFEAYTGLLGVEGRSFDDAKRRMADYVAGGMKLAPVEPTFTQQRDAVLAYVFHTDRADFEHFATAFVNHGMGTGAQSPPLDSDKHVGGDPKADLTFEEVVEDSTRKGELSLAGTQLLETVRSCDGDGIVDPNEIGEVTLTVANVGMIAIDSSQIEVTADPALVTFPEGGKATGATIDPYGTLLVRVAAQLAPGVADQAEVKFDVKIDSATSFTPSVVASFVNKTNYDEQASGAATDDVEASKTPWRAGGNSLAGSFGEAIWGRSDPDATSTNTVWHGADLGVRSTAELESPDVVVAAEGKFVLSFEHRYEFESDPVGTPGRSFYDGGVLEFAEVTGAGGALDWQDVTKLAGVNPGYAGTIGVDFGPSPTDDASENPLLGRPGYVGETEGAAEGKMVPVSVDFGAALAGKTVRFRFRIASDVAAGAPGWDIDNIKVEGATNTPFTVITPNAGDCAGVPTANAGPDQTVKAGDPVTLDASGSTDPTSDPLAFRWEQLDGPGTPLQGGEVAKPTFTAPNVAANTDLVFRVRAADDKGAFATDTVTITVTPSTGEGGASGASGASGSGGAGGAGGKSGAGGSSPAGAGGKAGGVTNPGGGGDDDDGCGCSTVGTQTTRGAWLSALAASLAFVRRRRRNKA
ncbi:MAG: M36 family metallopeptidase [Polyangiaceae bacterium]|nr:M36 family metallopeptidase [Polyangiaceae bacterium]